MSIKLEKVVQTFYEGAGRRKTLRAQMSQGAAMWSFPVYACNACGNYETEWYEISGKARLHSIVLPAALSSKPEYKQLGKNTRTGRLNWRKAQKLNAVVRGISKRTGRSFQKSFH